MKVVFAGTPEFARVALARLHAAGFQIPLVLTQPDRPAGRGLRLQPSPVKAFALEHGIAVMQPPGLRLDGRHGEEASHARDALRAVAPDVIVVAAYGLILPAWLLSLPPLGCINIHASLLPRWRGAAPIHRAIEAGDAMTGVTIMQMDEGLDTGAMLRVEPLAIASDDSTGSLQERLAVLGGEAIVQALNGFEQLEAVAQPADGVSYARKVEKSESRIDWRAPAAEIERRLRAFDPFPGATGVVGAETVKCWRGRVVPQSGAPGEVLAVGRDGLRVACGDLALELTQLQRAGGRRVGAAEFLQQLAIVPGMRFELPAGVAGAGQRAEI